MAPKATYEELEQKIESLAKEAVAYKRLKEALRESEERFRMLSEANFEGIAISDNGIFLDANYQFASMVGCESSDLIGKKVMDFVAPESRNLVLGHISSGYEQPYEHLAVKVNGSIFPVEVCGKTIPYKGRKVRVTAIQDISERKRGKEALQESEEKYRDLVENINDVIFAIDDSGRLIYISPVVKSVCGYSPSELIGRPFTDFIHAKDLPTIMKRFQRVISGNIEPSEYRIMTKSGKDRWVRSSSRPVYNGDRVIGLRGVLTDITEKKRLEAQLFQAQKMEAIGTFAGGIAHDFNNILYAIIGYTELSLEDIEKGTHIYGNLQEVLRAGKRAKDLVQHILTFSRQAEHKLKPVQVKTIAREALQFLKASLPATIEIRQEIRSDGLVLGDPTQIHQVLMNLCANASHALQEKGGLLEIRLVNEELDFSTKNYDIEPGKYIKLTVSDTGPGMTPDVLEKIFDPFFTTKEKGEGTGMGLSTVHGIIKSHGGTIFASSELGKGSIFNVYFPVIERGSEPEVAMEEPLPTGTERILFVDDEKAIVDIGKQSLEALGYDITARTSSVEALELFKAKPDRFDLIITDVTMPNMTGEKLAKELLQIRPDIPVILCTGFSTRIDERKVLDMGIRAFISKPILKQEIAETIRSVLDGH